MSTRPKEEWRPVVGWEDKYEVSSLGRVRNRETGRVKTPSPGTRGGRYPQVSLTRGRMVQRVTAPHRLVAEAFLGALPGDTNLVVDHIDGDGNNNRLSNLRLVSQSFNGLNENDKIRSDNKSGVRGLHFIVRERRWIGYVTVRGRRRHHGSRDRSEVEAWLRTQRTLIANERATQCA